MSDYRAYPTQAGQHFEALAKSMGYPIQVAWVVIGKGILPDDQSPYLQTKLLSEIKRFPAAVRRDENNPGIWIAECAIPADDNIDGKGYVINELGLKLGLQGAGILYAYRRVPGDVKQVIADGSATSIYYRIQFIPSKDAIVNATIDPTIVWVSQQQMTEQMESHKNSHDPHPELKKALSAISTTHAVTESITLAPIDGVTPSNVRFMAPAVVTISDSWPNGSRLSVIVDHGVDMAAGDCIIRLSAGSISTPLGADQQVRIIETGREFVFEKINGTWRVS